MAAEEHTRNRDFFCTIMAACALASARVRDGALVFPRERLGNSTAITPETLFEAAHDNLPSDFSHSQSFDTLRACALLALASLQDGKIKVMRMYIGYYFTMVTTWGWHEESSWPASLCRVEKEERRRLYWSIYTLDVFTSIVWDGCVHFQEAHSRVEYPEGDQSGFSSAGNPDWIEGWNFTTDLYRILEHVLCKLRTRHSRFNLFGDCHSSLETHRLQERVNSLHCGLHHRFKEFGLASGVAEKDIYGFQAANIQATLALLRMALLSLEGDIGLDKKCSVVNEVLTAFHQVPKTFQRAISTPLVYHIGSIGNILGSVMEGPLSESSYQRVRSLLLSMADLLEGLESFLQQRAGAGQKLRQQVDTIDDYMLSRQYTAGRTSGQRNNSAADGFTEAMPADTNTETTIIGLPDSSEMSPLFQIPDDLLSDWDWSLNMYQSQFPYFDDQS
ncbi:C6 transcription factor [Colletotrichum chrysophilum]|uniref:C6 transcription factor n=1 Tax=Colletotrichum chrysophilum TaxID=1836956 RepID=A0AAD9ABV2_9PEZI|nr:C6 transcription factor [Colletotrichum chrysophilum]